MFSSPSTRAPPPRRRTGIGSPSPYSSRAGTPGTPGAHTPTYSKRRGGRAIRELTSQGSYTPRQIDAQAESDVTRDAVKLDVDSKRGKASLDEGTILARDDISATTVFSKLPLEISEALGKSELYEISTANVDVQSGYAYLVTTEKCFVWSFISRGFDFPTCYVFQVSQSTSTATSSSVATQTLPLCSFVLRSGDREPGFVMVTSQGDVSLFDSVTGSTAESERANHVTVPLGSGETITALHRCEGTTFVLGTTHSRLFKLILVAQQGRLLPRIATFSQPRGIFGRLFGTTASFSSAAGSIISLISCPSQDVANSKNFYAVGKGIVQKWLMSEGANERLLLEQDIRPLIASSLSRSEPLSWADVELVDAAATSQGTLAVLYKIARRSDLEALDLGIATISVPSSESSFQVENAQGLRHQPYADVRPYSGPRLILPNGGPVAFIVVPNTILIHLSHEGRQFEDVLGFKDSPGCNIIGFGAEESDVEASQQIAALSLITPSSGTILLEVSTEAILAISSSLSSPVERSVVQTNRLKAKVEQAVFHGDTPNNPLSFMLPTEFQGNLMEAAEHLSSDIVQSKAPRLASAIDLRAQLADRLYRLETLILFISGNGALGKLSQSCRRRLCSDAELICAGMELWQLHNEAFRTGLRQRRAIAPLANAVGIIMENIGQGLGDNSMRKFFHTELYHLTDVFAQILTECQPSSSLALEVQSSLVGECNRVVLAAVGSASRYREENESLYRLGTESTPFEAWTSRSTTVELLNRLFKATNDLIQERTRQLGSDIDRAPREIVIDVEDEASLRRGMQGELKGQLCELADLTLASCEERLGYLSASASSNPSMEREKSSFEEDYVKHRSGFVLPLVAIGRQDRAFALAEKHRDFPTLTLLCNMPSITNAEARTNQYLQRFRQSFAFELYSYYLANSKAKLVLEQDESFGDLVLSFLEARDHPRISWLHDIAIGRFQKGSQTLLTEASDESNLGSKRLMLSLGKLAYVSDLTEEQVALQSEQQKIEIIDDQLDLTNVHIKLAHDFEATARQHLQLGSLDDLATVAEDITDVLVPNFAHTRPAFRMLCVALSRRLLEGAVLSSEDLIDLLTLINPNEDTSNYTTALEVFARSKAVPPARAQTSLSSLWRRVVLCDDWQSINDVADSSDEEVRQRLLSTALFSVLQSALSSDSIAQSVVDVYACLERPSEGIVKARFGEEGEREEEMEALLSDYSLEVDAVRVLVENADLAKWWNEVLRLIRLALEDEEGAEDSASEMAQ